MDNLQALKNMLDEATTEIDPEKIRQVIMDNVQRKIDAGDFDCEDEDIKAIAIQLYIDTCIQGGIGVANKLFPGKVVK